MKEKQQEKFLRKSYEQAIMTEDKITEWIGIGAGICSGISLVPQLYKIIHTKKADNISYAMLAVLIIGLAGWVVYGIRKNDWPLIVTNAFAIIINLLTIGFSVKYKENKGNGQ